MIVCDRLTKKYGDLLAVDHVSIQIVAGICVLVGPNGAGKSTLLKMLTGLVVPDEGSTAVDDKRSVGVVPEDLGLFDSLTVHEHLQLCGSIYGIRKQDTAERAEALIRILALHPARDTFLDRCSHGTRKKTALAMALLHNPRVLFLDEPFEGIDPVASETIQALISTISKRGITVFFTSHQLAVVERMDARVLMIRAGRIVWDSLAQSGPYQLDQVYFELVETPPAEDLPWLRSSQS